MKTTNWNIGVRVQKQLFSSYYGYLVLLITLSFTGCKYDDLTMPVPNENVRLAGEFIQNNYDTQLFNAALKKTGYDKQLNENGPFTVLVPSDNAFKEMGIMRASDFDKMNIDSLKRVIGYHILPRRLYVQDIPSNSVDVRYATLEGSELYTSLASDKPGKVSDYDKLYFSGAKAIRTDVAVANGVLHILEKVMKPQFETSVHDWLSKQPKYSVFVEGLKQFGLWDELAGKGPFTIIVPNNEALEKIGITAANLKSLTPEKYDGNVLFGAYIIYKKHYFISDPVVFSKISGKGSITYMLRDNKHNATFSSLEEYPTWYLTFGLGVRAGTGPFDGVIGSVSSNVQAEMDYLCSNGLIHKVSTGLMKPEQAIKK